MDYADQAQQAASGMRPPGLDAFWNPWGYLGHVLRSTTGDLFYPMERRAKYKADKELGAEGVDLQNQQQDREALQRQAEQQNLQLQQQFDAGTQRLDEQIARLRAMTEAAQQRQQFYQRQHEQQFRPRGLRTY